jgi:hypothetical protein
MNLLLLELAKFLTTPIFRWIMWVLSALLNLIKYLNEPQRFSNKKAFTGMSFKWHLYALIIISSINFTLMALGMWVDIPFKDYLPLPDYWYIFFFIICIGIITQITLDSPIVVDDGSFNPPPAYMFPEKYRIMITYADLIVQIIILLQTYIYFGIADLSKKTVLSRYFLERFGGWYTGNKIDFLYEWAGLIDIFIATYILYLQTTFQACDYGLPSSWNF